MNPIKLVLSTLNSKYIHSSLASWCLLSSVREYCGDEIEATVVEGTLNEGIDKIALRIKEKSPDVIGFSCYIWNIEQTKRLIELLKSTLPDLIIILGGPEVSYNAFDVLSENPLVDFIISGEGEKSLTHLLNSLLRGKSLKDIQGLCKRDNGEILVSPLAASNEQPISPYVPEYFEALKGRIAYIETSRGCPFSCAFCLSGRCSNTRYFDIERAKKDIILLSQSGTKTIKFVDRTFNANKKRAKELFGFIIENYGAKIKAGVCFHFEIAGDILDDETINLLASSPIGAIQFEIGLQSFNEKTLENINRKTDIKRLTDNINRLVEMGNIHIHIDLIAGLPFEDITSFKQSFNKAVSLKPHMLQVGFLKLLHGSIMREQRERYPCEFSQRPPYEVISTPWLTRTGILELHFFEDAFDRIYNSGRFRRTIAYVLLSSKLSPFDLFYELGIYTSKQNIEKISLDDYMKIIFDWFLTLDGVDREILRDNMVLDRLATNSSGKLPKFLQVVDSRLKKIKETLNKNDLTKNQTGIKRGIAILYSSNCFAYADYENKNPVTGQYKVKVLDLDTFNIL